MSTVPLPPDYYERPDPPRHNWKRIIAWIAAGLCTLILIFLIGITALLHNKDFRLYILRVAQAKLSEASGISLRMNDFSVHLSGLSPAVDMFGVVVEGAPPYQTPPVLQVDHLAVGVQIVSLLSRKWYLKEIAIDHPVARVLVTANGDTNLPKFKSSGPSPGIFDIGIRHVAVGQGEVYYNDKRSALDADLHDLDFQSSFDTGSKRYSGDLSYKNGAIHFGSLNPMVHSLQAAFEATPDTFTLTHSKITSGNSDFSLSATLDGYVHPNITGTYQSSLDTSDLRQILKNPALPAGVVNIAGSGRFENDPRKPLIQNVTLDGNISSNALQVHTPTLNTQVRDLSARYTLLNGDAEVQDLRAKALGGSVDGGLKMHDLTGAQAAELHATAHNIALASLQALVNARGSRDFKVTGTANAKIDANWKKTLDTLAAHTDAEFKGTIAKVNSPVINADGSVHAAYSAARQQVSFDQSFIRLPETTINLNGTVSKTASLQVQVQSNDLREVETAADVFGLLPQPLQLEGSAAFDGTVRGSTVNPQIAGHLSAASLKVKGTGFQTFRTGIDASPSHVALQNAEIIPASNRGRVAFNLNLGLDHWKFSDASPFQIDANAAQLNIAELKNLAGVQTPVTGTLAANISLHGSELNPAGGGTITLSQATVSDEPIQSATIDFQGAGDEIRAQARLRMPAGSAQATLTYFPKRKAYDGQLQTAGLHLEQLRTLRAHNINLTGTLNLSAKASGTLDNPEVQFTARIPQLQIENERINGITLQADVANHIADLNLDSESPALKTFVSGHGRVNLTGPYQTDATLDTASIPLQPLFSIYMPAQASNLSGQTELHATIHGPLKDKTQIEAHVTIPMLTVAYRDQVHMAAAQPIRIDYSHGILSLQRTSIQGTDTDLQLQGTVPINSSAPITLVALGKMNLALIQLLDPDVTSAGEVQFNINGTGRRSSPDVQGQVTIVNASVAGDSLPVGLQNGNGVLVLTNSRLDIRQFTGNVSGGTLSATGGLAYRPAVQFNVALNAKNIRTLYPEGVREAFDTNLSLAGTPSYATLRGQVRLADVSFAPSFDLGNIMGTLGAAPGITAPPGGLAHSLHLDIGVVSTNDLNLTNSKLSIQGAANLRVSGTAAQPAMLGRVNLTGGDLIFRGSRYILQPSTLDFVDPYQISPRINLAVDTTVQQYDVHLLLRGTMDRLRTTYTSEPSLPPSDIINLLVFGKTSEAQNANPTPGNLGAESMIASSVASDQVTSRIERVAGISQLSVDPVLGGTPGQNPGARVTVQQRVTGNMFVTFATDATSTQTQIIKLEYQATPRVSLSGVRDQNGGFAFDIRIRKTW